jgi:hypothetical protein
MHVWCFSEKILWQFHSDIIVYSVPFLSVLRYEYSSLYESHDFTRYGLSYRILCVSYRTVCVQEILQ